jgi:hypothetical protein
MAKYPLVVTFSEDKHDTSSTFICNNVEEYKKVIQDCFRVCEEEENIFFGLAEDRYEIILNRHKQDSELLIEYRKLLQKPEFKHNTQLLSDTAKLNEKYLKDEEDIKTLKCSITDYKTAKKGNVKSMLYLLQELKTFGSYYKFTCINPDKI